MALVKQLALNNAGFRNLSGFSRNIQPAVLPLNLPKQATFSVFSICSNLSSKPCYASLWLNNFVREPSAIYLCLIPHLRKCYEHQTHAVAFAKRARSG